MHVPLFKDWNVQYSRWFSRSTLRRQILKQKRITLESSELSLWIRHRRARTAWPLLYMTHTHVGLQVNSVTRHAWLHRCYDDVDASFRNQCFSSSDLLLCFSFKRDAFQFSFRFYYEAASQQQPGAAYCYRWSSVVVVVSVCLVGHDRAPFKNN